MGILGILLFTLAVAKVSESKINKTAYYQMPPLYDLDAFDICLDDDNGLYCIMDINLSAKNQSSLMDYIIEYSSNKKRHFRRDHLHRGICVTRTCKDFFHPDQLEQLKTNESLALDVLDRCMNYGLETHYGLRGKVRIEYCNHKNQSRPIDGFDIAVGAILVILYLLNVLSTSYDIYVTKMRKDKANKWLVSFSLLTNWNKLTSIPEVSKNDDNTDNDHVGGLEAMKFLTMIAVIFSHMVFVLAANYISNPEFTENSLDDPLHQFIYNGPIIMQLYFCIASFLLSYKFFSYIQKNKFNFWFYPMGLFQRWLRLTPVYALVLAFVATWVPHIGYGPLWDHVVTAEKDACRQFWWTHLLYINNYNPKNMFCLFQSWYLGADSQLFCFGLAVLMFTWKFPRSAKFLLPFLVLLSILIPAVQTYVGEYEAIIRSTPENFRTWFSNERTYKEVYIAGHTNASGAMIGLWAGYLLFCIRIKKINLKDNKWLQYIMYPVYPFMVGIVLSGFIFFRPEYVYEKFGSAVYAGLVKALFSAAIAYMIIAFGAGFGGIYKIIVDWYPLQVPGKLTYCALFIHPILQRGLVGIFRTPFYMNDYYITLLVLASVTLTYLLALPLALMVELPASNLQKLIFFRRKKLSNQTVRNMQIANNISPPNNKEHTQL